MKIGVYGGTFDPPHMGHLEAARAAMDLLGLDRMLFIPAAVPPHKVLPPEAAAAGDRLALRWGADPEAARRAGILHDCTKYLDLAEQLKLCDEYGIVLDDLEQKAVKLLHSKTGAAIARHVYGAPDEVCDAIYWHTTGKADMTLLEKVLYLADYIEPSREEFPGLKELRRLAYEDLDQALLLGCRLTIEDMEERGVPVHTNTLQARDWLKGRNP